MGGPIQFYQSNHLRVIFSCIANVVQCLFIFDVFICLLTQQKVRKLMKGKNYNKKKRMVRRLVWNIAAETPLRDHTPNPEVTAHCRSKTTLSWADGWVSVHRKRKSGWQWDRLGPLFIFTQRQLLSLLHPASSRGRSRQSMPTSCTVTKVWNMAQERKRKNES